MKWLVHEDDVVRFEIEEYKGQPFIHCTVYKKFRRRHINNVLDTIKTMLWFSGARTLWAYARNDRNTARFAVNICGFKRVKPWREGELLAVKLYEPKIIKG